MRGGESDLTALFYWKKSPAAIFSRPYTGAGGKKRGFCRLPRRVAAPGPAIFSRHYTLAACRGRRNADSLPGGRLLKLFIEVVGWVAAVIILAAYGLLSAGKVDGKSALYQSMNVIGAVGFMLNSGYNRAFPSAVVNVIWIGIGVFGLIRYRSRAQGG